MPKYFDLAPSERRRITRIATLNQLPVSRHKHSASLSHEMNRRKELGRRGAPRKTRGASSEQPHPARQRWIMR